MSNPEESLISRKHLSLLYALLVGAGIALYFSWGLMFNVWFDIGIYSVSAVMIGFGIIGFFLYSIED
ncbi:MAG: hypothetical protein ACOC85_02520 [Thermoplasmatota archaeon]